jgi:hypothetical protein
MPPGIVNTHELFLFGSGTIVPLVAGDDEMMEALRLSFDAVRKVSFLLVALMAVLRGKLF